MAKCNDYWCEHYNENKGNCDKCVKPESAKDRPDLRFITQRRTVKQMELDKKSKTNGQKR